MAVTGPLHGRRIVEIAGIGPLPLAGMILADLGAEVVRVDRVEPGPLADFRTLDPTARGRRSIALDLKHELGREVVEHLVSRSDVLIEGFRPGVMERLGLGPDRCLDLNPKLVYGRMTGWGQEGPLATLAGHDINYLAATGVLSALGTEDEPLAPLNLVADYGGGAMFLLVGVLAALDAVARGAAGQVVDAAMVDGVTVLSAMIRGGLAAGWWQDRRQSNLLDGGAPFYRTYRTADDKFLAVGALEPQFYSAFIGGLGFHEEDLPDRNDRSQWPDLTLRFSEVISGRSQRDWTAVFAGTDACVYPVNSLVEAVGDDHLVARRSLIELAGFIQPAPAPRFSISPPGTDGVPVAPGAHTFEVLRDLGYSETDIGKLRRDLVAQ